MPTQKNLEEEMRKIREWADGKMDVIRNDFTPKTLLESRLEETCNDIEKQFLNKVDAKKQFKVVDDQIEEGKKMQERLVASSNKQKDYLKELKKELKTKAEESTVKKLAHQMKGFATYDSLKELYNKIVPQLKAFELLMEEFKTDHRKFEEMLVRYDEIMAQKANKTAVIDVEQKCKQKYVKKESLEEQTSEFRDGISGHDGKIEKLEKTLQLLNENLSKDIYTAVRKVAKQMEG